MILAVTLTANTAPVRKRLDELALLAAEAGDLPESLLCDLRSLADEIGNELSFGRPVPAARAGEWVVDVSFKEGGRVDDVAAALRAFRDGNFRHGASV